VIALPNGFSAYVTNIGIKDETDDFVVIVADRICAADGVFTQSLFAGPSVLISRRHLAARSARAMVIISKNANVANGPAGFADAEEVVASVATRLGCDPSEVLIASTGVIGRRYPMDRIRVGIAAIPADLLSASDPAMVVDLEAAARGIMTTDTVPKIAGAAIGTTGAHIVGIAKGVGMIEPNMATLITVLLTDALVDAEELSAVFRRVIDRTFNCVSIDTDTSTSDTAIVLASGAAGSVDTESLEAAMFDVARSLTRQVARDGEGAETLIEVTVDSARDPLQARRIAKSIVNSPLVKTAVHGADPNWGRVAMAIGKSTEDTDIDPDRVVIRFASTEVYPTQLDDAGLAALSEYLGGDEIEIRVSLGTGDASATVWGCDLTEGYIRINADYTT